MNKIIAKSCNAIKKLFSKNVYVTVKSVSPSKLLSGKTVLITGGSSGIGYAIAQKSLEQGAKVVITGSNKEKLSNSKKNLEAYGEIYAFHWDIADISQGTIKIHEILKQLDGTLNCLVNNAGIYMALDYSTCTEKNWDAIFNTNLKGPYFATNEVIKYFIQNNIQGNIVNISSETGSTATTNPYAFTKMVLNQYTKGLAYELCKRKIRVNAVAPGGVATEISGINPDSVMNWKGISGRLLRPEEIAEVVTFLLSDSSMCINGEVLTCNEGNTLNVEYFR